jgi:hypothetical protein
MNKFLVKVAAGAAMVAAGASAHAFVQIGITDTAGGTVFCSTATAATVAACSAGFAGSGAGGALLVGDKDIRFSGMVGGFVVSTTSLASNTPGTSVLGQLDQSSTRVERMAAGVGTLFIDSFGFNYTNPAGPLRSFSGTTSFSSSFYDSADLVATVLTVDPANAGGDEFAAGTVSFGTTLNLPAYDGSSQSVLKNFAPVNFTDVGTYSIRHKQSYTIAFDSVINATATSNVRRVPEPVSASLVGLALVGMAFATRRNKKA